MPEYKEQARNHAHLNLDGPEPKPIVALGKNIKQVAVIFEIVLS